MGRSRSRQKQNAPAEEKRGIRQELGEASQDSEELQVVEEKLAAATKALKRLRTRTKRTKDLRLTEELWEAWRARRMSEVHRLLLRMAGAKHGPKKRMYNTLRAAQPSSEEWVQAWMLPGSEGGTLATPTSWETVKEERQACADELEDLPYISMGHWQQTKGNVKDLCSFAIRAPNRNGLPCSCCACGSPCHDLGPELEKEHRDVGNWIGE